MEATVGDSKKEAETPGARRASKLRDFTAGVMRAFSEGKKEVSERLSLYSTPAKYTTTSGAEMSLTRVEHLTQELVADLNPGERVRALQENRMARNEMRDLTQASLEILSMVEHTDIQELLKKPEFWRQEEGQPRLNEVLARCKKLAESDVKADFKMSNFESVPIECFGDKAEHTPYYYADWRVQLLDVMSIWNVKSDQARKVFLMSKLKGKVANEVNVLYGGTLGGASFDEMLAVVDGVVYRGRGEEVVRDIFEELQQGTMNIRMYVAALKRAAANVGLSVDHADVWRRFWKGLNADDHAQLLSLHLSPVAVKTKGLTMQQVSDQLEQYQVSHEDVLRKRTSGGERTAGVNAMGTRLNDYSQQTQVQARVVCWGCGEAGHPRYECPKEQCRNCLQYGHFQNACPDNPNAGQGYLGGGGRGAGGRGWGRGGGRGGWGGRGQTPAPSRGGGSPAEGQDFPERQ